MDRFVNFSDFDKNVILNKISDIASQLEEERSKDDDERDVEKEKNLIYQQWIQGLKLSTQYNRRTFNF